MKHLIVTLYPGRIARMLSEFQQKTVWDAWLSAQIRAGYFAALVARYQTRQRAFVVGSLLLSSGATLTLLTSILPPHLQWVKPLLTVLAGALSLWSLVARNERNAIDCSDLHFRWNTLAMEYEDIWADGGASDAADKFSLLRKKERGIIASSASIPEYTGLLTKMKAHVVMHHQGELPA